MVLVDDIQHEGEKHYYQTKKKNTPKTVDVEFCLMSY